jgi:AbrB family looped-hinge helix DNA binding protein
MVHGKLGEVGTVTSKSMITIPGRVRAKYGFKEGSKIEFVETEGGVLLIPVRSLRELRGSLKPHEKVMRQAIRELEREHREEARL